MKKATLTPEQIATPPGKELLDLTVGMAMDGRLELEEIKALRRWLRANDGANAVPAVGYLNEIMTRIAADGKIDRDELVELHVAIEKVIPSPFREQVKEARKLREAAARERVREQARAEKAAEKARLRDERERAKAEENRLKNRLRHEFAKVAGVTFQNDDGSQRQEIIAKCRRGDPLALKHDAENPFSVCATTILRESRGIFGRKLQQCGYAPEYLAEKICAASWTNVATHAVVMEVTGGTADRPTRGMNFALIYSAEDVTDEERIAYIQSIVSARA